MADDRTLSVEFAYAHADMQAYCRHMLGHSPLVRRFLWIVYPVFLGGSFLFPFVKAALAGAPFDREVWEMAIVGGIIPGLAMVPITLWFGPWMLARQTLRNPVAAGPRTVTLTPEGVSSHFPTGDELRRWEEVAEVAATRQLIIFYWNTAQGLPVPRRAFFSEVAADSFLGTARQYQQAARSAATKPGAAPEAPPLETTVQENRISVSYRLEASDFAALQRHQLVGARSHTLRLVCFALVSVPIGWFNAGWVGAVLGPVLLIGLILAANWYQRRQLAVGPHARVEHRLIASSEGVETQAQGIGGGRARWALVRSVDGAPEHVFVTLVSGGSYVVPRRAFGTWADSDRALELMQGWHQRGQGGKGKKRK